MNRLPLNSNPPAQVAGLHPSPLLSIQDLGVKYIIGRKAEDLQSRAFNTILRRNRRKKVLWALRGVNIIAHTGNVVGIIGSNGAGKSTLCKIIAGILRPDEGQVSVRGSVSALLSLGIGFSPELSGRENVLLNGMMLGKSRAAVNEMIPRIIEFSGIGEFIDQPLKKYSSGMKSRLGFSIAATVEPDIVVLDEALSAGDRRFKKKAGQRIQMLMESSKLVIMVTHQVDLVEKYCTQALWLDQGRVVEAGPPDSVVAAYKSFTRKTPVPKRMLNLSPTTSRSGGAEVIRAEKLSVRYRINASGHVSDLAPPQKKQAGLEQVRRKRFFWALQDVSFTLHEGDILGVLGPNGAGKSTLCKLLCGVLRPDGGDLRIRGELSALLSFGAGFNIQLSGRDNIYLNGMMLGIPKAKLGRLYPEIVDFSGIEKFIQEPVKNYSSGMRSRLGFSIATAIQPDILIIDEALNAGDLSFYEKASARIQEMIHQATSVVVVTHNLGFIEKVCTRAMWLDEGKMKVEGLPADVIAQYKQSTL